jgi:hypothetical protein
VKVNGIAFYDGYLLKKLGIESLLCFIILNDVSPFESSTEFESLFEDFYFSYSAEAV